MKKKKKKKKPRALVYKKNWIKNFDKQKKGIQIYT